MTIIERFKRGYAWVNPLNRDRILTLRREDEQLEIVGLLPMLADSGPCDLVRQHEKTREERLKRKNVPDSPHIKFANADTDEKLIAFVQRFGPVVAHSIKVLPASHPWMCERLSLELKESDPLLLSGKQEMHELRNERLIYSSALALNMELGRAEYRYFVAQKFIAQIASHLQDWPSQWNREMIERKSREPVWRVSHESLQRIQSFRSGQPDRMLGERSDAKIVMCELLNAFPQILFPNAGELHSSILHGIRPLLYAILRREFLHPHEVATCANTQCRQFFEITRAGQQFCSPSCSQRYRQREYWRERGKILRRKRAKRR